MHPKTWNKEDWQRFRELKPLLGPELATFMVKYEKAR